MIDQGARLVRRLDETEHSPLAAFWLYYPDREKWRLVIVFKDRAEIGIRKSYERILNVLIEHEDEFEDLDLPEISVEEPRSNVVRGVRRGAGNVLTHYTEFYIRDLGFADLYIYRLPKQRKSRARTKAAGKAARSKTAR